MVLWNNCFVFFQEEEERAVEVKHAPYMVSNYYDKTSAMVPYAYGTYGYGAGAYPPYYGQYMNTLSNGYYGYMTYAR